MAKPSISSKGIVTYVNKPIILSAFTDDRRSVLCPVRALWQYVEVTRGWRATDQLFVCHGDHRKGTAVSKDRLSHWVTDTFMLMQAMNFQHL